MKYLSVVFLISLVVCLSSVASLPATGKYTTKYDNINLDQILQNDRLLKNYMDCVMDRGRCTKEGLELKKHVPEAIATECAKCSEKQKKMAGKVLSYLLQNRKHYWDELLAKYDPEGNFRRKYSSED